MAITSITEFSELARDRNGNVLPLGKGRIACQVRTSMGSFSALSANTKIIRVATDTTIRMDIAGGSTDTSDELFPANSVEYLAVNGGETLTIA
jgi:hypothetical protein